MRVPYVYQIGDDESQRNRSVRVNRIARRNRLSVHIYGHGRCNRIVRENAVVVYPSTLQSKRNKTKWKFS